MDNPYEEQENMKQSRGKYDVDPETECNSCGHAIKLHNDRYGCQYERGDTTVFDNKGNGGLMAMGPCGCKDWGMEDRIDLGEIELEEQAKQDVKLEDWLNDVYKRLEEKKMVKAAKEQNGFFFDAMKRNGVL